MDYVTKNVVVEPMRNFNNAQRFMAFSEKLKELSDEKKRKAQGKEGRRDDGV